MKMCINKKINMKALTPNYLYQSLNESLNDCPSLLMIYQLNKSVFDRLFKATLKKGFTFTKLKENDIVKLTPAEAFKYGGKEGDKYIKLWLTSKKEVGIVTWANTMIDDNFNWNAKARGPDKRNNSKLIGIPTMCQGYLKKTDYLFSTFTRCYMIPFEKLGKYSAFKAKEEAKAKATSTSNSVQTVSTALSPSQILEKCITLSNSIPKSSFPVKYESNIVYLLKTKSGNSFLALFDKFLPYYRYSWGSKYKTTGSWLHSRWQKVVDKKGIFVNKGNFTIESLGTDSPETIIPVAKNIDSLNAGVIYTLSDINKLLSGKNSDELDIDIEGKMVDISLIDKKFITSPYIPRYERGNGLGGVIIDTFLHSIVSEIRYPNKSIIMCVNEDKKVAFYQISYTKNDILFTFITPFYDRGTKPKNPLPEWSDGKFMHNSIMLYDLVGMYVIANSYNDFCKNKFLSFADNQKMDIMAQNKYNELIAEKKAAAEAVKLSVKQENAEFSEKIKPFTEQAKKVKEKISAEIKAGINELIKSKPSTWNDVLSFWEYRIKEISKLMVKDNVSVFDGHIINTCGFYYAGETKNGVTVLKNLYGAPGVSFRASYIDESAEYRIKAFYEWVRKGRPSTDYDFLIPQTIISCNNGRIGIYSSGISIPAGEKWHFSTNNGKNGNGTISLKTDGIFIATDHARRFGSLYTFK